MKVKLKCSVILCFHSNYSTFPSICSAKVKPKNYPCHWTELLSAQIYSENMENIIFYRPPTRQHHPMEWRPLERDTMTAHRHVCGGGVVTCRTLMVIIILIGRMGHWFHHNLCGGVFGGWKSILGASIFARQSSNKSFGRAALQATRTLATWCACRQCPCGF